MGKFKEGALEEDTSMFEVGDKDNDGGMTKGGALEFYRFDLQSIVRKEPPQEIKGPHEKEEEVIEQP